jgi:glycosyltransferase involved in cell wall biosynthesis
MRILCLLPSTLKGNFATTSKRTLPLMKQLSSNGNDIILQENLAHKYSSPEKATYLLTRACYVVQSLAKTYRQLDLIYASKVENAPLSYLLSKKLSVPYVVDSDDLEKIGMLDFKEIGTKLLLQKAGKVFVASNGLKEIYNHNGIDSVYLPNSTDLSHFNPNDFVRTIDSNEPTFLWVSDKIDWVTGCKLIFNSFRRLKKGRLIIIGGGPKVYFRELSEKLGIAKRVIIKDWVSDDELPILYRNCDFGLLPFSDNPWTKCKCPSRLFEFMAMELPYLCTVGEPAYMASKCGCGLVAKPVISDFSDKMQYAVEHIDELKIRGKKGREFLLSQQNLPKIAMTLEDEFKKCSN